MYENLINVMAISITVLFPLLYIMRHRAKEKYARTKLMEANSSGLMEPVSLHPKIDPNRCISTGACVGACPEGEILGLIDGKAVLLSPSKCIGHGACYTACPVDGIELVFGTERRGVEIPHVKENFETNVPGIYIAGELGGMGLIRNAVTQGREAIEYLAKTLNGKDPAVYDVAIVGAGPAGLSASLQAKKRGLRFVTMDQDDIGGAILTFPRQKLVMTQPMEIPLYGKCNFREIRKEEMLDLWSEIIGKTGIHINAHEKLENVQRENGHFQITTSKNRFPARRVLLAIGRRGTPRKLGVQGEQSAKVAYKLIEPEQYRNQRVLVVGGGDSAVEAALSLAEQEQTDVILSYRKNVFSRIKEKNRMRIEQAIRSKAVHVLFNSQITEINPSGVVLTQNNKKDTFTNDQVFIFAGGELPSKFLAKLGIHLEIKHGER